MAIGHNPPNVEQCVGVVKIPSLACDAQHIVRKNTTFPLICAKTRLKLERCYTSSKTTRAMPQPPQIDRRDKRHGRSTRERQTRLSRD